ncbi:MAG: hypothetical protein F6K10_17910 [Moorea sp. SIO2B7]|nr:hypothetical protein [Moorena sp. SIO2B7]
MSLKDLPSQLDGFSITASSGELITGLGVWNASGDDELFLAFYDEFDVIIESTIISASRNQAIFGGIVNNQGASRVEISGTGNANRWIAIDNLQIYSNSSTTSVSEPSTALALLVYFGLVGLYKFRKGVGK